MRSALLPLVVVCVLTAATVLPEAADPQAANPQAGTGQAGRPPSPPLAPSLASVLPASVQADVTRYCVSCHNARANVAGLALDRLDPASPGRDAAIWEKVVRRLQTRAMPPSGAARPDDATYHVLVESLVAGLDAAAAGAPYAGRPALRRLNRAEYGNAVRDLLALEVDPAALLPGDDSAYGFDTTADVLGVSPSLQERYLAAAARISALAVGDMSRGPIEDTYRVRQDLSQNLHVDGLAPGTIGGLRVRHFFPLTGEYTFQVRLQHTNFGNLRGLDYPHEIEVAVDGRRVHVARVGGEADLAAMFAAPQKAGEAIEARLAVRVQLDAGPRDVTAAFIRNVALADTRRLQPFLRSSANTLDWTGVPHLQSLTITGPFAPTMPGDTPSRRRIFLCRPQTASAGSAELPCARRIIRELARRAYRQPVTDDDVAPLLAMYRARRAGGSFESGIQQVVQALLASPRFLFRLERDPDRLRGSTYAINDVELASRLSFFLWSSIPDDELLELAIARRLRDRAVLAGQVARMLADSRAQALVSNFAGQWLQLRNVSSVAPNSETFPDFDDNLRQSFRRETELLFATILREDRSVLELLTADYTFLNERLARHYGVPNVYGSRFRRVPVTDDARRGLFGHGSILALTSHAERTSPVVRGKWVLDNILGTPPPPPPPDVNTNLADVPPGAAARTMRQRMDVHRANPTCAACHRVMDPIGLAMENFDAVGAWRTDDHGAAIDASGELADGTRIDGVVSLRNALVARPGNFVTTMAEKMLIYALGRGLDHRDAPTVRAIVRRSAGDGYRFSSLVLGIVESAPFLMREAAPEIATPVAPSRAGR